jgi:hypothetical protein
VRHFIALLAGILIGVGGAAGYLSIRGKDAPDPALDEERRAELTTAQRRIAELEAQLQLAAGRPRPGGGSAFEPSLPATPGPGEAAGQGAADGTDSDRPGRLTLDELAELDPARLNEEQILELWLSRDPKHAQRALKALRLMPDRVLAVELAIDMATSGRGSPSSSALRVLEELDSAAAAELSESMLLGDKLVSRYQAAGVLGRSGSERSLEPLRSAYSKASQLEKIEIAKAMANLGDPSVIESLVEETREEAASTDAGERAWAARQAQHLDELEVCVQAVGDPESNVRMAGLACLQAKGSRAELDALADIQGDPVPQVDTALRTTKRVLEARVTREDPLTGAAVEGAAGMQPSRHSEGGSGQP